MNPVFIHVPRTGGNSLLPHLCKKGVHIVHHVEKTELLPLRGRWVFAFMRDPCDRVVSAYAYLRDGGGSEGDAQDADKYVRPFSGLEDFVLHGLSKAAAEQRHFRPQSYWLTDEAGRIAPVFLGRTERMQQDFDRVCEACGWETVALDTLNSSKREGLSCTPEMREVIKKVYEADYRLLQDRESFLAGGLLGRIQEIHRRNSFGEVRDVIWNTCMERSKNTELTEANLLSMCQTPFVTGFGGGGGAPEVKMLAEALGVCGISNPENDAHHGAKIPPPCNLEGLTADDILDRIQAVFPAFIHFPPYTGGCVQGLHTARFGTLTNRYVQYLWVLKRILELCPKSTCPIIEIGAGFGVLGYFLHGLGYRDYTVIDLSLINACQTYFLTQNLPGRKLILSGEVSDPFDLRYQDAIKLLHATDFRDVPANRFAIMINMDGLTEYGLQQATRYVQSDCAPLLLSINHEVNPYRVCDIPQPLRRRAYRYPFWLRPGYVEELYVPKNDLCISYI